MEIRFFSFLFALISLSHVLIAETHDHPIPSSIEDVFQFHHNGASKIKDRYGVNINKTNFFSDEEKTTINNQEKYIIIDQLLLHEYIKLRKKELLIDFTESIQVSGYSFNRLEEHIIKYIKKGSTPFAALTKAIQRLQDEEWYKKQLNSLSHNDPLMENIEQLKLPIDDHDKVRHIYAICINSWRNEENRNNRLKPKICDPVDDYRKPRHRRHPATVRTRSSSHPSEQTQAYTFLVTEAASVADDLSLSTAERVVMAKCVAEKSLRFFEPVKSPVKSLLKLRQAQTRSPEHEFFAHQGVCLNFAGIAYNLSRELGLENHLYLANNNFHTYLEVEIDGTWYHSHPFNSSNKGCDLTRFGKI